MNPKTIIIFLISAFSFMSSSRVSGLDSSICTPVQGFGRNTTGGQGYSIYRVTNLNDAGPGSLRDALSQSNRDIKFDVAGTIALQSTIRIDGGSNITIDGFSAPSTGITINGSSIGNFGDALIINNSNNIIVRGIRIQSTLGDTLQITRSSNLVVTRNTISFAGDGALDATIGVTDMTISWNIIADTNVASLIKYTDSQTNLNPQRFTIHNNLYTRNGERNPLFDDVTDFDYFNNVIYGWGSYGILITNGATGNLIGNYFMPTSRPHAALWRTLNSQFYLAGYRPKVDSSSVDLFPNFLPDENWNRTVTEDWSGYMAESSFNYGYPATYTTAQQALLDVLSFVGPKLRTAQDWNYIDELISATGVDPGYVVCDDPARVFDNSFEEPGSVSVPANVSATPISSVEIVVNWDASSDGESGIAYYNIWRDGTNVGQTAGLSFSDTGLDPQTTYAYEVSAVNGDQFESERSSPAVEAATPSSAQDLIAHWDLEEGVGNTTMDVSGNGFDGVLVDGALWTVGQIGNYALDFDGADDHVDVGSFDVVGGTITLSAWFRSDSLSNCDGSDCRILSKATGVSAQDHYFMLSTVSSGGERRLRFRLKAGGSTSTLIGSQVVNDGQWYHVAGVYDGVQMRLYQNAVEVGSLGKAGAIDGNPSAQVWIGSNPPSPMSRPWDGQIDDVRIYVRPLTLGEIEALADSAPGPSAMPYH